MFTEMIFNKRKLKTRKVIYSTVNILIFVVANFHGFQVNIYVGINYCGIKTNDRHYIVLKMNFAVSCLLRNCENKYTAKISTFTLIWLHCSVYTSMIDLGTFTIKDVLVC